MKISKIMREKSFSKLDLKNKKLREREWDYCKFEDCNFEYSDLSDSIIENCEFINCNFYHCDMDNCYLKNSIFRECNIKMVNLLRTDLTNADFSTSNIDYSSFPLWCGSFNVILDDKQKQQLLYHLLRIAPEYRSKKLCAIANGFEHSNRQV
jgi:uncharacterized protein YjbI with pentapeptide repeats